MSQGRRTTRWLIWPSLTIATGWSLAIIVGASTVEVIGGVTVGPKGARVETSHTLIDELGSGGYVIAVIPLVATLIVALLAASVPRVETAIAAAAAVGALGILNLLAMLTVGIFIIPTTAALAFAVLCMFLRLTISEPSPGLRSDL